MFIKSKAQLDTLNYLKQFEANRANYIGQPFSKLLQDMIQIQPKTVWPSPNFKNKNYNFSTRFKFCNVEQSYFNVITLSVEWETPIPVSSSEYYQQLHDFYFTNDEKNLYGSKIVKDIKVYR
ncbi:hypothetical protein CHA01nite_13680 [Chryseobacterium hagamense]|uniref:Uncharacterized protein n=2 Tax=Chryseobacterium hagamense TaxID=395935 RepID=A0A511YKA3_9FLAO|nr:hypothetical protein CHA01nite_13680 [Chryseobacterium hagamense]